MARIREKAIEQGLIRSDANLSDAETAQLIFAPGFSTASQVDELSGRGVGMDVVRNTVAELGGRIEISSKPGKGTAFVVRLPLTLAVTQVMLVSAGTQRFALNTSAVEQVLQMKPSQLADAHRDGHLVLDEVRVPLHYLGHLCIGEEATPAVQHLSPVLIVQVAGERMALHSDAMSKTQEVVIKPVGPQIAGVPGIVGATILGDGEIVLILNPVQMARLMGPSNLSQHADAMVRAAAASLPPTVMVVDDSVTVRKVTQRLLQREGYEVMLAKDGLDALRQLEERQPEVMLLDIEMPRMDGFDLTRNLRADSRFLHLPIIMISSRTGEKHRGIAESIGVNHFLGKPYDEDSLLHLIERFVKEGRGQPQGSAAVLTTA
jgi:chemosensory pili system protein ChpA (sensor histidine kinase/response regulator)